MKLRHVGSALMIAVVLLGLVAVILLRPNPPAEGCTPVLDLNKVRALADSIPGEKAREVRIEEVVELAFPGTLTHAGTPPVAAHLQVAAFQLVFPDRSVVIDAGMTHSQATVAVVRYNDAAWNRLAGGLAHASAIYLTHEHLDHLSGLFAAGQTSYQHARFTPEQLAHPERAEPLIIPPSARAELQPLAYEHTLAVAPGVVLIKAPGHTPGSQWIFVSKQDGTELLFVGDSAWFMGNIDDEQGPPLLMSFLLKNDRPATACQLQELHTLGKTAPTLVLVPGHDGKRFDQLVLQGVILPNFAGVS